MGPSGARGVPGDIIYIMSRDIIDLSLFFNILLWGVVWRAREENPRKNFLKSYKAAIEPQQAKRTSAEIGQKGGNNQFLQFWR